MAKIVNPVRFSTQFRVDETILDKLGVLDPSLNIDTTLFIDPLLLAYSRHREIRVDARATYRAHFEQVIKLLRAAQKRTA